MAEGQDAFARARGRTMRGFRQDEEYQWKAPFYFIQGADPQFGLMKAWAIGDCDSGGDEWEEEIKLTEQAVQAINKLNPKPKFFVLCGDLIHGMPGTQWRKDQEQDLKNVLKKVDQDIPLVFVSGNHDIGNAPTPETIDDYCKHWGDDYFSFWIGGVFFLVLNSQLYFNSSKCPELKQAQDEWLNGQLAIAEKQKCKHVIVFQHIPLFLKDPDEDHDYFNLEKSVRHNIMEKFQKAAQASFPACTATIFSIRNSECVVEKGPEKDNITERSEGLIRDSAMTPTEALIVQFFVMNIIMCIFVCAGYYLIQSLEDKFFMLADFVFVRLVPRTVNRATDDPSNGHVV